jgi:hypothetical protein
VILDFRWPILDCGKKQMQKEFRIWFVYSCSDNRKSKIANPKWLAPSVLAFVLVMTGAVAQAQQPTKVPRIGVLAGVSPSAISVRMGSFRQGLRELGYVEGKNIVIESRYAEENLDRLPALAAELVRLKVKSIITGGPPATRSAKKQLQQFPLSWGLIAIPLGMGSSPALRDLEATLRDCRRSPQR